MNNAWSDDTAATHVAALTARLTPQPVDTAALADALALVTSLLSSINPYTGHGPADVVAADLSVEMAKAELGRCLDLPTSAHPLLAAAAGDLPAEQRIRNAAALVQAASATVEHLDCGDQLAHAAARAHLNHALQLLSPQ